MKLKFKLAILAALCLFVSAQTNIGGQLKKAALENRTSDPSFGNIKGRIYYDTAADVVKVSDGTSYIALGTGNGNGDVTGPGSATSNAIPVFDGTGGKTLQDSPITIANGGMTIPNPTAAGLSVTKTAASIHSAIEAYSTGTMGGGIRVENNDAFRPAIGAVNTGDGPAAKFVSDQGGFAPVNIVAGCAGEGLSTAGDCGVGTGPTSTIVVTENKTPNNLVHISMRGNNSGNVREWNFRLGVGSTTPTNTWVAPVASPTAGQVLSTSTGGNSANLQWITAGQLKLNGSAPTCVEGFTFYNTVSDYVCFCDATATPKQMHSPATSCF